MKVNAEGSLQDASDKPQEQKLWMLTTTTTKKYPAKFRKNILWTDEIKLNLYQNNGQKKMVWKRCGTAHGLGVTL